MVWYLWVLIAMYYIANAAVVLNFTVRNERTNGTNRTDIFVFLVGIIIPFAFIIFLAGMVVGIKESICKSKK